MMGQLYKIMPDNRTKITDLDIQALVDGELPPDVKSRYLEIINHSPDLFRRYNMYMQQKTLLKIWYKDN